MISFPRLVELTRQRRGISASAISLGLLAAAIGARLALAPWLEPIPFLTFFPAVVATTLLCGWRYGTVVLVLSALSAWYFFIPPHGVFSLPDASSAVSLLGFLVVGGFDVVLVASLVQLVWRLEEATLVQKSLFHELQHRVANNMQIVTSMLQDARRGLSDTAAVETIDQAVARVAAMAKLHRRLYDRSSYMTGLEPILRDVLAETFHDLPVETKVEIGAASLSIDQMTAILLLVNEAAINAAKHVFRLGQGTRFEVELSERVKGRLQLVVRDDGPGLAPATSAGLPARRLGMTIMQTFAGQLGGSLEVTDEAGTTLYVEFPTG